MTTTDTTTQIPELTFFLYSNDAGGTTCMVCENGEPIDSKSALSTNFAGEANRLRSWVGEKYPTAIETF